jgi:hypothetical protein
MSTITTETKAVGAGIIESYDDPATGIHVEKRGDGTMVQYGRWLGSTGAANNAANYYGSTSGTTYYRYKVTTFPEAFVGALPIITATSDVQCTTMSISLSSFGGLLLCNADPTTYYFNWVAFGRWRT